ncbi:hypothetical protein D9Q98_003637 [Chlorella vulgaris]|nr:hypothetical protein D9Q98_003637 [Chlorella vulgaris]
MEGGGSPGGGASAGLLYRGGSLLSATAAGLADFAEFADESRLGELPSEEDLRLLLFDPAALPAMPGHSQLAARAAMLPRQQQQQQQQQHQHQQQQPSLRHSASFCGGSGLDEGGVEVVLVPAGGQGAAPWSYASPPPTVLRIRTGAGAPGSLRAAAAQGGEGGSARGSPKRRADRMDLDGRDADSMRDSKRHSSSAWSDESDGGGDTPSSAAAAVMPHPSWFEVPDHPQQQQQGQQGQQAQQTQQHARASSLQPTRFARESGRRQGGRSSGEGAADPAYLPSRERSRALSRQQQQQQQQASEQREEDEVVVVQQFRGVSRHSLLASLSLQSACFPPVHWSALDVVVLEDAAHAYDLAALACKGLDAQINFSPDEYAQQLQEIAGYTRDEVVAYVRRRSSAFSRGKSRFRGVSGHNGRWEARIGSFNGRKNVSFGVFETEEGAARQYDRALILEKGRTAKTNFPIRDYDAEATEYETHLMRTCGATTGPAAQREALTVTLPADREATADEKKRAAVIYADALMRALRQPTQRGGRT